MTFIVNSETHDILQFADYAIIKPKSKDWNNAYEIIGKFLKIELENENQEKHTEEEEGEK
jgi:hypothetical protein